MAKSKLDQLREEIKKATTLADLRALMADVDPADRNKVTHEVFQQTEKIVGRP